MPDRGCRSEKARSGPDVCTVGQVLAGNHRGMMVAACCCERSSAQGCLATMSTSNRLELIDVVTVGHRHLVHVFYDQYFQGAIHEAAFAWRAKLHPIDLGDFRVLDEAKEAVSKWFIEFERNCSEQEESAEIAQLDDFDEVQAQDFPDPSILDQGE